MKLSKKFFEDLTAIGNHAFIEKNMWVGKCVPEIIADNLRKRGISQEDIEDCVVLSTKEAKAILQTSYEVLYYSDCELTLTNKALYVQRLLKERIEEVEKDKGKTNTYYDELDLERIVMMSIKEAQELALTLYAYHEICQKLLVGVNYNFLNKASKVRHNLDKKIEQVEKSSE